MPFRLLALAVLLAAPAPGFADQIYALTGEAKAKATGIPSVGVDLEGELVLRDDRGFSMTLEGGGEIREISGAWLQEGRRFTLLVDLAGSALDEIEALEAEASAGAGRPVTLTGLKTKEKLGIDGRGRVKIQLRFQYVFRAEGIPRPLRVKEQIRLIGAPVS